MLKEFKTSKEVKEAIENGVPIVALETTVITHGMKYPDNLEIASQMQEEIRQIGACPATLAIVDGRVSVGMEDGQLEKFSMAERSSIMKCSRRDIPGAIGLKKNGSLTVSATALIAHAVGIKIFATGGIGGVHRGNPFDVSSDLTELSRTPVAVICSGAKSILDLELTLQVLETSGVPVVGLGTRNLPAFFASDSGLPVPTFVETIDSAIAVLQGWQEIDSGNGIVFAVPVPETAAIPIEEAEKAILLAVDDANANRITGNDLTPYLLERIAELTDGRSLASNKALLRNNAITAAKLAVASDL